jgi:hypothetical protein
MPEDPQKGSPEGGPRFPRLVVRRDAQRELEYRYDREERLALGTAPRKTDSTGSFFKSRTHRRLLLNVALLAAVAFVALQVLSGPGDRARIGPFAARLEAMPYESTVYITLTLRYAGRAGAALPAERFTARFVLEPGGEQVLKTASLPASPGEEVTVGEAFPLAGAKRVRAELLLGNRQRTLARDLGR